MVTERELPSFWQERRDGLDIAARFLESEVHTWLGVVPGRHKARLDIMVAIDAGVDVGLNPPPAGIGDVGDVGRIQVVIFDLVVLKGIIAAQMSVKYYVRVFVPIGRHTFVRRASQTGRMVRRLHPECSSSQEGRTSIEPSTET